MKKWFIVLGVLLMVPGSGMIAYCAPFLVCDPQAGVTLYRITLDPFFIVPIPAQPDGSLKVDLVGIPSGTHSIAVAACKGDPVWGEVCSATSPFSFVKPTGASTAVNIRIVL
jgi:hypothetical protein